MRGTITHFNAVEFLGVLKEKEHSRINIPLIPHILVP